ncbi:protein NDNF [Anoplophora glabripennis]|uniref:protein NDNF n=1 Tax=Anoplophora glabripennis TaxID=217634 RepID=UPI00087403DD|nr:protein NDNF [Anoplophora glabripennis]
MMIFLRRQLFFLLILLIKLTESDRKSKRTKEYRPQAPSYEIYRSDYLPSDSQVTTFLLKGELKLLYYLSPIDNGSLSTTIITCSSPVQWSMKLNQNGSTAKPSSKEHNRTFLTEDMTTKNFTAFKELYVLQLTAPESDTYVHIYISTEADGPQALRNSYLQKLRLQKRQKKKRLTIRWEASLVDPQGTDYCLTVSSKKNYKTLCSAQAEKFGVVPPSVTGQALVASQAAINWKPKGRDIEKSAFPLIACVGRKRQYTVPNLKQGQTYYFDLFATNRQSNLTYFFGSTSTKFDSRIKPISLRDGKSVFANLRKFDGKIVFKFKVGKVRGNPLNIFIMPCGALIDAEVSLKGKTIISRERIEKMDHIAIKSPEEGARYHIKTVAVNINREGAGRNSGVEVFATSKSTSKIPLPTMPSQTAVEEIASMRKCNSVTVAWLPSPGEKVGHYCILVKEGKLREEDDYGIPNQCGLESRLKKSVNFDVKCCKDIRHNYTNSVITEKINYLGPGKSYVVQVIVKKPKGKSLAYDLLQVHTTPSCHKY